MLNFQKEEQLNKKVNELRWDDAVKSKDAELIRNTLKSGITPRYLNATLLIHDADDLYQYKSSMDLLLERNVQKDDTVFFDLADSLLKKGARLPKAYLERSAFNAASNYFDHLARCPHDLYLVLRSNPAIIKARDENGMTILHHVGKAGTILSHAKANLTLYLLFTSKGIDLNLKDKYGNTPLHQAAFCDEENVQSIHFFSDFLNKAWELGADLFTLNKQGQSVLDILEQQIEKLGAAFARRGNERNKAIIKKRCQELLILRERLLSLENKVVNDLT